MRIGELSNRTGASVRALRYYEEKGVLSPDRTPSGYRAFSESDVHRVAHIQTLLAAGLGMDLIAQILACLSGDSLLLDACRERLEIERRRITDGIDHLTRTRSLLDELLTSPPGTAARPVPAVADRRARPARGASRRQPTDRAGSTADGER